MWSWAICTDTCAICRNNLYEPSIEYQANPTGEPPPHARPGGGHGPAAVPQAPAPSVAAAAGGRELPPPVSVAASALCLGAEPALHLSQETRTTPA